MSFLRNSYFFYDAPLYPFFCLLKCSNHAHLQMTNVNVFQKDRFFFGRKTVYIIKGTLISQFITQQRVLRRINNFNQLSDFRKKAVFLKRRNIFLYVILQDSAYYWLLYRHFNIFPCACRSGSCMFHPLLFAVILCCITCLDRGM